MQEMFEHIRVKRYDLQPFIENVIPEDGIKGIFQILKEICAYTFTNNKIYHHIVFPFGHYALMNVDTDVENFLLSKNIKFERIDHPFELFWCGLVLKL